ncbi:MAG: cytochrome c [Thiobacillus sp.]|nr:cytochrome c [Thiobacillus sp.]
MRTPTLIALCLLQALIAPAYGAADAVRGKALHDKQCVSCHVKRYGGDGAQMYLRPDRLIHDRKALSQRVATCNAMVNAGLFPEDEEDIAAYLAKQYYKFAK